MSKYKISISGDSNHELSRNIETLLSTRAGSQPADREFGISWECLDEVPEVAESLFFLEVSQKVEKYEPRVEVDNVIYETEGDSIVPHIYLVRRGD